MLNANTENLTPEEQAKQKEMKKYLQMFLNWVKNKAVVRALLAMASGLYFGDTRKISVVVNGEGKSYTDGKKVVLSPPNFFLNKEEKPHWSVALRALLAHEISHLNHSNFTYFTEVQKWFGSEMKKLGFDERIGHTVAKKFLNIFEDGRVEELAVEEHRGLFPVFRYLNAKIREDAAIDAVATDPAVEYSHFSGIILSYAKTGMFPKGTELYEGSEMETYVVPSLQYIDEAIRADAEGCYENTKAFLLDVAPYLQKLLKDSPKLQEQLKNDASKSSDYEGVNAGEGANAKSDAAETGEATLRKAPEDGQFQGVQDAGGSETGITDGQGSSLGFAAAKDGDEEADPGYSEEALAAMEAEFQNAVENEEKQARKEQSEAKQDDGPDEKELAKMLEKAYGAGNSGFHTVWPMIGPKPLPQDVVTEAKILRKEILKVLEARTGAQFGVRSGYLDSSSLWKTGVGEKDIFYRPAADKSSCAFYIAIDLSGSMSENVGRNATKSFVARRTAAVIEEVSRGLFPTKIALYRTSRGGAEHICIKPFEAKGTTNYAYSSLSCLTPGGYNEDSAHIRTAAMELAKRKEQRKFLFVLSDGLPSAYGSKDTAEKEVRKAVEEAANAGIVVIPIMFGDQDYMQSCMKSFQAMYPKNLIVCEPKEIARRLPQLFRTLVLNR